MPLHLCIKVTQGPPIELDGVLPERLRGSAPDAIRAWPIWRGNRRVALGDCFVIAGDASDGVLAIEGDLSGVHAIGQGMTQGEIHVHGRGGHRLGMEMAGGRIRVEGDVGDGLGLAMSGGTIAVSGSAGDLVAGARPGAKRGMTGGVITIGGAIGGFAGLKMRRGLLAVAGGCGQGLGHGMIAGTIVVGGDCGNHAGVEMRRGSIVLCGRTSPRPPLTFRPAGSFRPVFLRLLVRELERLEFAVDPNILATDLELYHGDMLALGKGEIWIRS